MMEITVNKSYVVSFRPIISPSHTSTSNAILFYNHRSGAFPVPRPHRRPRRTKVVIVNRRQRVHLGVASPIPRFRVAVLT